jgi:signal peptidase I
MRYPGGQGVDEDVTRLSGSAGDSQPAVAGESPTYHSADEPVGLRSAEAADVNSGVDGAVADSDLGVEQAPNAVETPPHERNRVWNGIRELVETIVLALIFFFALRAVVQNFRVEGSSMFPSFADGQYVLVNKAVYTHFNPQALPSWLPFAGDHSGSDRYLFSPPQRGDVIVFHPPPPNDPSRDFIKRVIGVPGDTVDVHQGHVYVNGAELDEPYIRQPTLPINARFSHVVLGPDQYFVLGDNRGNSSDSRAWGPVSADAIVGRTWLVYWPFSALKVAPNHQEAVPSPVPATPSP